MHENACSYLLRKAESLTLRFCVHTDVYPLESATVTERNFDSSRFLDTELFGIKTGAGDQYDPEVQPARAARTPHPLSQQLQTHLHGPQGVRRCFQGAY